MENTYDPTMETSWFKYEQQAESIYELIYVEHTASHEFGGYDKTIIARSHNKEDILKIIEKYNITVKDRETAKPGEFIYNEERPYLDCYFKKEQLDDIIKEQARAEEENKRLDEMSKTLLDDLKTAGWGKKK